MSTEQNNPIYAICFMPDAKPAPEVMTEQEVVEFLRLDNDDKASSSATLKYYRDKGLLKGIKIGKKLRYTKQEVLNFLERLSGRSNKSDI